jgi:hypothetical protein
MLQQAQAVPTFRKRQTDKTDIILLQYNYGNFGHYPSSCILFKTQFNCISLSVPHRKHITSPLRAQQVNAIILASLLFSIGLPNGDWKPIALNLPMSPLPLVEQHVPGSTSTTSNFPKQKKLSILGHTWTDASPGISTSLPNGNILVSHSPKCTGCWAVSPNSVQATNF